MVSKYVELSNNVLCKITGLNLSINGDSRSDLKEYLKQNNIKATEYLKVRAKHFLKQEIVEIETVNRNDKNITALNKKDLELIEDVKASILVELLNRREYISICGNYWDL